MDKGLNQQKGMTLIEVLLATMLSSLFFCYVIGIMTTGENYLSKMKQEDTMRTEMNRLKLFIEEECRESRSICIYISNEKAAGGVGAIDVRHKEHRSVLPDEITYYEGAVKKIVCDEEGKTLVNSKARTFTINSYIENNKQLFKILFQGQTLIEGVENIRIIYSGDQALLEITLYSKGNKTLIDRLILDLEYKK